MLAVLADIPPIGATHFDEADKLCTQLYKNRKDAEEEEILTYRTIIANGKMNVVLELKQWKMEEGIHMSSSEKDQGQVGSDG
ncbi:hypothetical protein PV10_09160 [Exophiala mesophila]|uniref:Uncharacterized protein n=1 Tax=Exophiala mesophila TaxID=212818 RepID=A0A0D1WGS9_EXOME|nr:uncharacterized protein PV10_09160 [Exophiala mesophila]KIV87970.1 hypothetical protein PV10_09160 [Exophiala mesophila]